MTALGDTARRFPRSTWIIEGDIKGCFDNINHGRLLLTLRKTIRDEKVIGLIASFLSAGYLERWLYHRSYSGTPQGGIISPLLAKQLRMAGQAKQKVTLCRSCHLEIGHHGSFAPKNQDKNVA